MSILPQKTRRKFIYRLTVWSFVLLYPAIASIYAFSPPLLGIAAFILIDALEKDDYEFTLLAIVYMLNIDVNFSLPMFLSIFSMLVIYTIVYPKLNPLYHCKICVASIIVILFNLLYLEMILLYSYVFKEFIFDVDALLIAYFIFDLMMVLTL